MDNTGNINWKLETQNVRGLQRKENKLGEFEQTELEILAITKKKGICIEKMNKGHIIIHSGAENNKRASGGVACLIHKKLEHKIED